MEPLFNPREAEINRVLDQLRLGVENPDWSAAWSVLDTVGPSDNRLAGLFARGLHSRSPWVALFSARALLQIGGELANAIPDVAAVVRKPDPRTHFHRGRTAKDLCIAVLHRFGRQRADEAIPALLAALLSGRTHAGAMIHAFRALARVSGGWFRALRLIWNAEGERRLP